MFSICILLNSILFNKRVICVRERRTSMHSRNLNFIKENLKKLSSSLARFGFVTTRLV